MKMLCLLLYVLAALVPAYAALRIRDYLLAGICAVAGLGGIFFFIPYIVAAVLVSRKFPKDAQVPFSGKILAGFWALFFLVFLFVPFVKYNGAGLNGIGTFTKLSWQSSIMILLISIVFFTLLGLVVSFSLRGRGVFTGGTILFYMWVCWVDLTVVLNMSNHVQAWGSGLQLLLAFGGLALIGYNAHCIPGAPQVSGAADNTAEGIALLKQTPGALKAKAVAFKNSEDGQKLFADLNKGLGKAAETVRGAADSVKNAAQERAENSGSAAGASAGSMTGRETRSDMGKTKEKIPLTARQKARRGMILGPIGVLLCYLFIFVMLTGFGESSAGDFGRMIPSMFLIILISPLYGFGFAFNWRRTLEKTCRRLGISAEVSFFTIIIYCFTKNKNHLIFGFFIAVLIPCWTLGMGWLPGIFHGIRELKEEHQAELEAGRASGKEVEPNTLKWLLANPDVSQEKAAKTVSAAAVGAPVRQTVSSGLIITCTAGEYEGAAFELLPGEQAVLGKDPARCNLIFSAPEISGVHCAIICPAAAGLVTLNDYSRNGTYFADGTRITPGSSAEYRLPCTICFGRAPERIEIAQKPVS